MEQEGENNNNNQQQVEQGYNFLRMDNSREVDADIYDHIEEDLICAGEADNEQLQIVDYLRGVELEIDDLIDDFNTNLSVEEIAVAFGLQFENGMLYFLDNSSLTRQFNHFIQRTYGYYGHLKDIENNSFCSVNEIGNRLKKCLKNLNLLNYMLNNGLSRIKCEIDRHDLNMKSVPVGDPIESSIFAYRTMFKPPTSNERFNDNDESGDGDESTNTNQQIKIKPRQMLLFQTKWHCLSRGWKRKRRAIYENYVHVQPDGRKVKTNYFKPVPGYDDEESGVPQMIKDFCSINENEMRNRIYTEGGDIGQYITNDLCGPSYKIDLNDPCLPRIEKNRKLFSMRDGFYNILANEDPEKVRLMEETPRSTFTRYEDGEPADPTVNFIDSDFDEEWLEHEDDWWDAIETPYFDRILEDQGFREKNKDWKYGSVYRWVFVLLGRLLYEIGELDNWQVMAFLLGRAGTGKSTILNVLSELYEKGDVKTIANKIETGFGLDGFADALLAIARDVGKHFALDPEDWKSIVGGEDLSIRRKNLIAKSGLWKSGMIMAGNERPEWFKPSNDIEGSISRRTVIIGWQKGIRNLDTSLQSNIIKFELGKLLVKFNLAYHWAIRVVGIGSVHDFIPPYMNDQNENLWSDPLFAYLFESGMFDIDHRIQFPNNLGNLLDEYLIIPEEYKQQEQQDDNDDNDETVMVNEELPIRFVEQTTQSPYYIEFHELCEKFRLWAEDPNGFGHEYELFPEGTRDGDKRKKLEIRVRATLERYNFTIDRSAGRSFKPINFDGIEENETERDIYGKRRRGYTFVCGLRMKLEFREGEVPIVIGNRRNTPTIIRRTLMTTTTSSSSRNPPNSPQLSTLLRSRPQSNIEFDFGDKQQSRLGTRIFSDTESSSDDNNQSRNGGGANKRRRIVTQQQQDNYSDLEPDEL